MGLDIEEAAATETLEHSSPQSSKSSYLLVINNGTSMLHPLPVPGMVTIGRDSSVDLRLDHSSISRRHAKMLIDRDSIRIADLDSRNGTRVNGAPIIGTRSLMTGDVIAIGEALLIVHFDLEREAPSSLLPFEIWLHRLKEEVVRAVKYQRTLAVLTIAGAPADFECSLRMIDVVARDEAHVLALLPEADLALAQRMATRLLEQGHACGLQLQVGIAICPLDATDPENLLLMARTAARAARPGAAATIVESAKPITMGDRQVLVCHPGMIRVFDLLERLAKADLPVLLIGETGVGKENAAYAVHHHSARRHKPFVAINCATLQETLAESQLFGHDRGAFTGAVSAKAGLFETASEGTLFLDEIGELSLTIQAKLLRVLETGYLTRVGETKDRRVDVRIVAVTNRDLESEIQARRFRDDLYFRLGVARVHLLPLRDRKCEIPLLFREFVAQACRRAGRPPPEATPLAIQRLLSYRWPGNVRELKHVAELIAATVEDQYIEPEDLPAMLPEARSPEPTPEPPRATGTGTGTSTASMRRLSDELEEFERTRIAEALTRSDGVKAQAAALLGMPIRTFSMKVKRYGL